MNPSFDVSNLLIRTLPTPNPFALKFVINAPFKADGKSTFNSPLESEQLPLVRDLFALSGVKQIHLFQNTLTVTHSGELDSVDLSEQVESVIRTRMPLHDPDFKDAEEERKLKLREHREHQDPQLQEIEEILDRTIRPGLQADGGDIDVISLENNELRIMYQGACGGCPSSMMGTLDAIQGILRQELQNQELTILPI